MVSSSAASVVLFSAICPAVRTFPSASVSIGRCCLALDGGGWPGLWLLLSFAPFISKFQLEGFCIGFAGLDAVDAGIHPKRQANAQLAAALLLTAVCMCVNGGGGGHYS